MNMPAVVSRDEWLAARKELLANEKEATRARDTLNTRRRNLPLVRMETTYKFEELKAAGFEWILDTDSQPMEQPGVSCFLRIDDDVFHTYSTYGRGAELAVGGYPLLDLTALGRQEEWEEPKGRVAHARPPQPDFA